MSEAIRFWRLMAFIIRDASKKVPTHPLALSLAYQDEGTLKTFDAVMTLTDADNLTRLVTEARDRMKAKVH